jgi:hypothetical protein
MDEVKQVLYRIGNGVEAGRTDLERQLNREVNVLKSGLAGLFKEFEEAEFLEQKHAYAIQMVTIAKAFEQRMERVEAHRNSLSTAQNVLSQILEVIE